jgi:hypothetical protein
MIFQFRSPLKTSALEYDDAKLEVIESIYHGETD